MSKFFQIKKDFSFFIKIVGFFFSWLIDLFFFIKDLLISYKLPSGWDLIGLNFLRFWSRSTKEIDSPDPEVRVLVEGLMSASGPNYLYRTALHANAVFDHCGKALLEVFFDDFRYKFRKEQNLYKKAGFHRFHFLMHDPMNFFQYFNSFFLAVLFWKRLKKPEDILGLSFKKIHFGDLLYDEIIKLSPKDKTINRFKLPHFYSLFKAIYLIKKFSRFIAKNKFEYYVSTHPSYLHYGIMCRVALSAGSTLILTTDIEANLIKATKPLLGWSPVYHEYVLSFINRKIDGREISEIQIKEAKNYLENRFRGKVDQVDVKLAFSNKRIYSKDELIPKESSAKKLGFILAHVMADAPHSSTKMIFKDYFSWLNETLRFCRQNPNVHWMVKPHPASKVYNEEFIVYKMLKELNADNVSVTPEDLNTASLVGTADCLLTMQGTAGLEFSCVGIPVILAGKPFYSGFGFTIDCNSKNEYSKIIDEAHNLKKINERQQKDALMVLAAYRIFSITNNLVFDSELLAKIWGYSKGTMEECVQIVAQKLNQIEANMEPQYLRIREELVLMEQLNNNKHKYSSAKNWRI